MLLSPVYKIKDKKVWENFMLYEDGYFYAFFGSGKRAEGQDMKGLRATALDIYRSADGVRFERLAEFANPVPGAHAGFCVKKIGEYFYYYPTCSNPEQGVHFKIYRTVDFKDWEYMGASCDVLPDRSIYRERWDEMVVLDDVDADGKPVYYGYISSEPREEISEPGPGMLRSYDGLHWEILPPAVIEWGEIPSQHMEMNFIEKIDGDYYLSMTGRLYMDSYGYSMYTFIGESPFGPFRPVLEKFRMTGNSRRDITWLGHTCRRGSDLLLAQWLSHDHLPEIPSRNFAIAPLKRVLCENKQLRLGYWESNDALFDKNAPVALQLAETHPHPAVRNERDAVEQTGENAYSISASRDGVLLLSQPVLDRERGLLLEGSFVCRENRTRIATHHHAGGIGFYFEGEPGEGTMMYADTLGVTRSGFFRYADHPITEKDIYRHAGHALATGRTGALRGTAEFDYEDTVGPYGHAAYAGIRHGRRHTFRLLARLDYFELYIDDLYVQTYLLPENTTGRVGFYVSDGVCDVEISGFPFAKSE